MRIRIADIDDIPAIVRLIQSLAEHDGVWAPEPEALRVVLKILIESDSTVYLVAELDTLRIIGAMQLDFRLTTWEAAPYVYIEDFIVEEQHRGLGVGSSMFETAKLISLQRGCVRMDLDVLNANTDARRFYSKHGFVDQQRSYLRLILADQG